MTTINNNLSTTDNTFKLCDSELWDFSSFWHGTNFQLSPCFRDTLLVWVPFLFFTFVIINETIAINKTTVKNVRRIHWNPFNILRLIITLSISLINFTEVISYLYDLSIYNDSDSNFHRESEGKTIVGSSISAPLIRGICYAVLAILYVFHRRVGRHTSASVWFYLLLAVICDSIDFYSVISSNRAAIYNQVELVVKFTHFPLVILLFLLECHGDYYQIQFDPSDPRPESLELHASFFSRLTFWWFGSFFKNSQGQKVKVQTLWKTLDRDRALQLVPQFQRAWLKQKKRVSETYKLRDGSTQSCQKLIPVLVKLFWSKYILACLFKFIADTFEFCLPLLMMLLLDYMGDHEAPLWHGFLYASLFLLFPCISALLSGHHLFIMNLIGIQARTMIVGSIYRKSLCLSNAADTGGLVNLMSVDAQRIQDSTQVVNTTWSAPYQVLFTTVALYWLLGWPVIFGVGSMLLTVPFYMSLSNKIRSIYSKLMVIKDERIKLSNELLNGIKIVKLYGWEESFLKSSISLRQKEVELIDRILNCEVYQSVIWLVGPFVVTILTFSLIFLVGTSTILTAERAFVALCLFLNLRTPLSALPIVISALNQTLNSMSRIQDFLNKNELAKYVTRMKDDFAISMKSATLSWSSTSTNSTLKDIDLKVKEGEFIAVIGQVASGKSSLLSGILGEMSILSGSINISSSLKIAYVPQQAWMQNMTVRDNILFGQPYEQKRYEQVLSACCLEEDLKNLPANDLSEIGERGINLSGGQKQRISLARACYSNSDLYLLDDPLSALDSHVAKHIYSNVLSSSTGLLKNKTRVLTTNSLFVLKNTDRIVVLKDGEVLEVGCYEKLSLSKSSQLYEYSKIYSKSNSNSDTEALDKEQPVKLVEAQLNKQKMMQPDSKDDGKLIDLEKEEIGSVGNRIYMGYIRAYSVVYFVATISGFIICQIATLASSIWLSTWKWANEDGSTTESDSTAVKLGVYAAIGLVQVISSFVANFGLQKGVVKASKSLHDNLIYKVLRSPMIFFETTPLGRILDRLANDLDVIDCMLHASFRTWFLTIIILFTTLFVISLAFPVILIITIPFIYGFYLFQRMYINVTRQLKRLEGITRSPIFSHFEGTITGSSTVRAYERVDTFISKSDTLIDINHSCSYPNVIAARWSGILLETFVNILIASIAFLCISYKGEITAGLVGLTLTLAISLTSVLGLNVKVTSELESNLVSVERLMAYENNKLEDDWVKDKRPPSTWPSRGAIKFKNYSTRYRDNTEIVLKDLSLDINPGEKIGIVGRTGSGKSTLSLCLFRILEAYTGRITIDNLNISDYGLHDLRKKLSIIPQDPVLFSGTLRFNLDPLNLYPDSDIWQALERANLKTYIKSLNCGLDYQVSEFGKNFSLGQRQLICLARAILRKSKILVLDEATASVDLETDLIVQKTIKQVFSDCAILTIAHRLHTILDSDRILVLSKGQVQEIDCPKSLLANPDSEFYSLAKDAGIDIKSIVDNKEGES